MKKILLTLLCGFGLTAGFAQEPAKVAKKKASKVKLVGAPAVPKVSQAEKIAIDAGKAKPATASKASLAVDKAN